MHTAYNGLIYFYYAFASGLEMFQLEKCFGLSSVHCGPGKFMVPQFPLIFSGYPESTWDAQLSE